MNITKIKRSKKLQSVVLIIILCAFYMANSSSETPIADKAEINIADIQTQPSQELQSAIDDTMSGFNQGFMIDGDGDYGISGVQLSMEFLESRISLRIPNYNTKINENLEEKSQIVGYSLVALEFIGSKPVKPVMENPSEIYYNYFYGSDPAKWISNTPSYEKLRYRNIYDNIDLVYSLKNGQLKYDFYVYPGGDYNDIQLKWDGPVTLEQIPAGMQINVEGIENMKNFVDSNPISFVEGEEIAGSFVMIDENSYGFTLSDYDRSKVLQIDPYFYFSTYIGSDGQDYVYDSVIDSNGDIYILGASNSVNFPTTLGVFNTTFVEGNGITISKLSADGSNLIFSTFLGGSGSASDYNYPKGIAIDDDFIYITGYTKSTDFPTTSGAFDETFSGGNYDIFISKISHDGTILVNSTYIGVDGTNYAQDIAVSSNGDVIITGLTSSANYPTTTGAFGETLQGTSDIIVTRLAANFSKLIYSTFIGGTDNDNGDLLAIDGSGRVVIVGNSASTDYPIISGAYDETFDGGAMVVSLLSNDGSSIIKSTFLGGAGNNDPSSMIIDDDGNIVITGETSASDYPTTSGAFSNFHHGGDLDFTDIIISKLSADLSTLIASTYIGSSGDDYVNSVAVDSVGNIYITGRSNFPSYLTYYYPITTEYIDPAFYSDLYLTVFDPDLSRLEYSTFIGTGSYSKGISVILDDNDDIYLIGEANNDKYPITTGAYDETYNGVIDIFVSKLSLKTDNSPGNLQFTIGALGDHVYLTWDESLVNTERVTSYNIYRGISIWDLSLIGNSPVGTENFDDDTVVLDQKYYYAVTAVNELLDFGDIAESSYSEAIYVDVQVPLKLPTAPLNPLVSTGEYYANITWDAPVDDGGTAIIEYKIYRGTESGVYTYEFVSTILSFDDSLVEPGVTYYYCISAVNAMGESVYSSEIIASIAAVVIAPPIGPTTPSSSSNLQAVAGIEYVYLNWTAPLDDGGSSIIEYWVYRGESAGDYDYILVSSNTEFNDTAVTGGTTYYYSVVAVNEVGGGVSSAEVSATPESHSAIEVTTTVVSTSTETTILDVTDTPTDTAYFPILVFIASLSIPIYIKRRKN